MTLSVFEIRTHSALVTTVAVVILSLGVASGPQKAEAGILGGALGGAVIGGLIGGKKGARTGAIVGGIAGAIRR